MTPSFYEYLILRKKKRKEITADTCEFIHSNHTNVMNIIIVFIENILSHL